MKVNLPLNVIEYEETKLREFFTRKLDEITKNLTTIFRM